MTKLLSIGLLIPILTACIGYTNAIRVKHGIDELPPRSVQINDHSYITFLEASTASQRNGDTMLTVKLRVGSNYKVRAGFTAVKDLLLSGQQYYYFELQTGGQTYAPRGSANNTQKVVGSAVETISIRFLLPKGSNWNDAQISYKGPRSYKGEQVWLNIGPYLN